MENIRNFCIIAHIDHGKSTLADRMIELTGTIEKRKMREQVLDQMELERERGITIKMAPVRMIYHPKFSISNYQFSINDKNLEIAKLKIGNSNSEYILNLIDTPGHIDFSYEVSRALRAVEGAILLVDATQGIQAQTLSVLEMTREMGLAIIPVLNKIDMSIARVKEVSEEVGKLLRVNPENILRASGKTGQGVPRLLAAIVEEIPSPKPLEKLTPNQARALIFDFSYSTHRGIITYVRVFEGNIKKGDKLLFAASGRSFEVLETGFFRPVMTPTDELVFGEIGYVVTGIKESGIARVGDTLFSGSPLPPALPGYEEPKPVVWASVYPQNQNEIRELREALRQLKLSDSALSFEEESSGALGRGFRLGVLGLLHLEIVTERLRREFGLSLIIASPTINYEVELKNGRKEIIYAASRFPDEGEIVSVFEPWVGVKIITPPEYLGALSQLVFDNEGKILSTDNFSEERVVFTIEMPLRELMRNFFDKVKSISSGFASLSYELLPSRLAQVTRLDILVADEPVSAFAKVVSERQVEHEANEAVEKLQKWLPRQLFEVKIQARAGGRIIASRRLSAMRKDVTGYLYGGDVTRKMKLLEKQKKGKKRMKQGGKVNIPHEVFLKMAR